MVGTPRNAVLDLEIDAGMSTSRPRQQQARRSSGSRRPCPGRSFARREEEVPVEAAKERHRNRKARPVSDALAELRRCSGTDFDPVVVEALAAAVSSST
jgi:hypothetical protein